jgi:hypothetical protein
VSKFPDTEITISVAKDHGIALPSDTGNITHTALRESNRGGHLVGVPLQLKKLASAHRPIVKIKLNPQTVLDGVYDERANYKYMFKNMFKFSKTMILCLLFLTYTLNEIVNES